VFSRQTNAEIARENGFNGNDHLQQLDTENTRGDRHSASIEEPTVIEHMSAVIDEAGGELVCPSTGVTMRIPPGALDAPQEIYIKVTKIVSQIESALKGAFIGHVIELSG
jgi:hypothetical protein